jgi:YVTN family beta-propeller protein
VVGGASVVAAVVAVTGVVGAAVAGGGAAVEGTVVDPATMAVIDKFPAGAMPHHITPAWDLSVLYVLDTAGNALVPIDPVTSRPGRPIPVADPYNLYFTPDGQLALVIAERYQRIDLRDPHSWALLGSIPVPHPGVNHGDFSADGRYFYATCEFSGWIVKVDLAERRVVAEVDRGRQPIDVKLAPDASAVFVADQARNGVIVLDPEGLAEEAFIPTGRGTHGLYPSRDGTRLYATNRLGGSVSVIDFASRAVVATWAIPGGGSPDMGSVSADGRQLWVTGRYHSEVYVINTDTGALLERLRTGAGPHGLTYFPQPGRFSLGHTGNYR